MPFVLYSEWFFPPNHTKGSPTEFVGACSQVSGCGAAAFRAELEHLMGVRGEKRMDPRHASQLRSTRRKLSWISPYIIRSDSGYHRYSIEAQVKLLWGKEHCPTLGNAQSPVAEQDWEEAVDLVLPSRATKCLCWWVQMHSPQWTGHLQTIYSSEANCHKENGCSFLPIKLAG